MNNFIGQATSLLNLKWTGELSKDTYQNLFDEQTCLIIEAKAEELAAAEPMRQLRIQRNQLLAQSDWRMTTDYPYTDQAEWASYRTALRDLPATAEPALDENGQLTNVVWPIPPND